MLQKIGYICAELRKPVGDTVYRKVLSKRAIGDAGYVYFVEEHLPPELSRDSSLTFIKIGKSENPRERLAKLQTDNSFTVTLEGYIPVTRMGEAERIAQDEVEEYHYRGEWYRFPSSIIAGMKMRHIREKLRALNLIRNTI